MNVNFETIVISIYNEIQNYNKQVITIALILELNLIISLMPGG